MAAIFCNRFFIMLRITCPLLITLTTLLTTADASALSVSRKARKQATPSLSELLLTSYTDSLLTSKARIDSLFAAIDTQTPPHNDADGRYFRLFSPVSYYHTMVQQQITLTPPSADTLQRNTLTHLYLTRPDLVRYSDGRLSGILSHEPAAEDMLGQPRYVDLTSQISTAADIPDIVPSKADEEVDMFVAKPNFWTFSGEYYLQFMQNAVSDNWYKGGSNSYSMLGTATLQYNYNNKQKVKWDNKLELKLGFQSIESDTVNKFKTSEDLIRLTSTLGVQAHKNWYYSTSLILNTQFAKGLTSNSNTVYSDFMSPFNLNLSIGMAYTVATKNKKLTGSVNLSPLAYNFKYVDRLSLSVTNGLDEGKHTLHDFGSQVVTELVWQPIDNFKWNTRFYAYTTYHKFLLECENTLTFTFSKYISSNVFLYPRFDDSASRVDNHSYWQFKEYVSFGFTYSM